MNSEPPSNEFFLTYNALLASNPKLGTALVAAVLVVLQMKGRVGGVTRDAFMHRDDITQELKLQGFYSPAQLADNATMMVDLTTAIGKLLKLKLVVQVNKWEAFYSAAMPGTLGVSPKTAITLMYHMDRSLRPKNAGVIIIGAPMGFGAFHVLAVVDGVKHPHYIVQGGYRASKEEQHEYTFDTKLDPRWPSLFVVSYTDDMRKSKKGREVKKLIEDCLKVAFEAFDFTKGEPFNTPDNK